MVGEAPVDEVMQAGARRWKELRSSSGAARHTPIPAAAGNAPPPTAIITG
jgi:hypothetical protein